MDNTTQEQNFRLTRKTRKQKRKEHSLFSHLSFSSGNKKTQKRKESPIIKLKGFVLFVCIIFFCVLGSLYMIEKTDALGLNNRPLASSFHTLERGRLSLSWERLPYPCYYRVDTYSKTTGKVEGEPEYHLLTSAVTFKNSYEVPTGAIPMYYRVTAYGLFGQLTQASDPIENPDYPSPARPVPITEYTEDTPASTMPFLIWHAVPSAVCYELELLSASPQTEGGTSLDPVHHLFSTRQIYTNGYQADLRPYASQKNIYWRVRALGLHLNPIGTWSKAMPIVVDPGAPVPDAPLINDFDQMPNFRMPDYPVYAWIPLHNVVRYEVELLTQPPAKENDTTPTENRVWARTVNNAVTAYDEYSRHYAGDYYWRVRAVDAEGKTIGHYSRPAHFIMPDDGPRVKTAIFGDSITHGGGAVSYPPASLEYSYGTYLDFPVVNIGKSGDTSKMSLERFQQDVLPHHPENLIILTGSNSLRDPGISADDVIHDLSCISQLCEQNDIRPIFLTLMPINPGNILFAFHTPTDPEWHNKMTKINGFIKVQKYHIDLEPYFYDASHTVLDTRLSIDGLHPDIYGKMLMGEIINMHKDLLR